jgi:DMSO/TMAO reductase YedYZ heme-binding membrane subunit
MVAAVAIIWVAYMIATLFPPTPPINLEYAREGDMAAYMRTYPTMGFVAVAIGYILAAFAGGFIATKMGRRWSQGATLAIIVGALLTAGSLLTATVWPQPIWFVLVSLIIFVPAALIGFKFADHVV